MPIAVLGLPAAPLSHRSPCHDRRYHPHDPHCQPVG